MENTQSTPNRTELEAQIEALSTQNLRLRKQLAMLDAMEPFSYNARHEVMQLAERDIKTNDSGEFHVEGFNGSLRDYFKQRAKDRPYELTSWRRSRATPKRSSMTVKQKADFITKHGQTAYLSLPE